jgi:exonuclease III
MKILFWNIRGLGTAGRRNQLRQLKQQHRVDVICLQETIKAEYTTRELDDLGEGYNVEWIWTEAQGHSGGTLIGVRTDDITMLCKDRGEFFSSMLVSSKQDEYKWEIINVYGPVQLERKKDFLGELSRKISSMSEPFVMGGDFNMIRFPWEKSTDNINQVWMDAFNEFIRDNGIKEMLRKGSKFTWTNKQLNPVMSVLDRVLVCPRWEQFYRRASCESLTRVGSDHNPIIVNTEDHRFKQHRSFRFEMAWLTQEGFCDTVIANWPERGIVRCRISGKRSRQQRGPFVKAGELIETAKSKKKRVSY